MGKALHLWSLLGVLVPVDSRRPALRQGAVTQAVALSRGICPIVCRGLKMQDVHSRISCLEWRGRILEIWDSTRPFTLSCRSRKAPFISTL